MPAGQRAGTGNSTAIATTVGAITEPAKLQRSSASKTRANPRDFTGKQKQELEAKRAEELAEREQEIALATAATRQRRADDIVDYSQGGTSAPGIMPGEEPEPVIEEEIEVLSPTVIIRVNAPVEDMVFGRTNVDPGDPAKGIPPSPGNLQFYNFEEGRRYEVPRAVAEHLDRIGYLYH